MTSLMAKRNAQASDPKPNRVAPSFKVEQDDEGAITVSRQYPDAEKATLIVMKAVGANDVDFYRGFMDDLAQLATVDGELNADRLNFLVSAVKGIEPRDQVEAMLAAQMAAVHSATLQAARRLHTAASLPAHDSDGENPQQTCTDLHQPVRGAAQIPVRPVNIIVAFFWSFIAICIPQCVSQPDPIHSPFTQTP